MSSIILRLMISHKIAPQYSRLIGCASRKLSSSTAPWLMLPPTFGGGDMVYNMYSPSKREVVSFNNRGGKEEAQLMQDEATELVGSSHGWLALFNSRNNDLFLSNPLSGRRIRLHPPPDGNWCSKVILSSSPDDPDQECRAMMNHGQLSMLASCFPGRSHAWTSVGVGRLDCGIPKCYDDMVYSTARKRFMCVLEGRFNRYAQDLECWDVVADHHPPTIDWQRRSLFKKDMRRVLDEASGAQSFKHLVFAEHLDRLYLVTRHINTEMGAPEYGDVDEDAEFPHKTVGFCVHRIDEDRGWSSYMEGSLDGLVMFVGKNQSLAVPASEFPELQPDSIYYTDISDPSPDEAYGGHDIGIFDYRNKSFSKCYYPCHHESFEKIHPSPIWYTPTPTIYIE